MDNTNETIGGVGSSGLGQAKKFNELTQEQQIQAMRQEIQHLHRRMEDMVNLRQVTIFHTHSSLGQVVMPVNQLQNASPSNRRILS